MIFVSTARPFTKDPTQEYARNQLAAKASWEQVATAIVYFGDPEPRLASPITRFIPSEPFPFLVDLVNFCADQTDEWCVILNADIWIAPNFKRVGEKLKSKRALAASSWRWNFDPAVGVEPCERTDNGLDFFAAAPGAWEMLFQAMKAPSPQGAADSPTQLRLGTQQWDSWCLGAFNKLFANIGFYDITNTKCVRHPIHQGRVYGPPIPTVHFLAWPVQGGSFL